MRKLLDRMVRPMGLRVVKAHHAEMIYQHQYSGGYSELSRRADRAQQKRKLKNVWADDTTLSAIAADLQAHGLGASGICHGARNGYEVA